MRILAFILVIALAAVLGGCNSHPLTIVNPPDTTTHQQPHDSATGKAKTIDRLLIASFTPTAGPIGTVVKIIGNRFGTDKSKVTVMFGTVPAAVDSLSQTQIVVRVPDAATTSLINLSVAGKTVQSEQQFVVTGPVIASFSPTAGPTGTVVTITGEGFGSDKSKATVMFGTVVAIVDSLSITQIVVHVPQKAVTSVINVSVNGKTVSSAQQFTVLFSAAEYSRASLEFFKVARMGTKKHTSYYIGGSDCGQVSGSDLSSYSDIISSLDTSLGCPCNAPDTGTIINLCCDRYDSVDITSYRKFHADIDTTQQLIRTVWISINKSGWAFDFGITLMLKDVPFSLADDRSIVALIPVHDLSSHLQSYTYTYTRKENPGFCHGFWRFADITTYTLNSIQPSSPDAYIKITISP